MILHLDSFLVKPPYNQLSNWINSRVKAAACSTSLGLGCALWSIGAADVVVPTRGGCLGRSHGRSHGLVTRFRTPKIIQWVSKIIETSLSWFPFFREETILRENHLGFPRANGSQDYHKSLKMVEPVVRLMIIPPNRGNFGLQSLTSTWPMLQVSLTFMRVATFSQAAGG